MKRFLGLLFFLDVSALGSIIPRSVDQGLVALGQGFDPKQRIFRRSCVEGSKEYAGLSKASIDLEHSLSSSELTQSLNSKFSGGLNLVLVSGKVETQLNSQARDFAYREILVYEASYTGKTVLLQNPTLTALGRELRDLRDKDLSEANCGLELVNKVNLGGYLNIFVEFNFRDQKIRNEFTTKVKVKAMGMSKTKTIRHTDEHVNQNTYVTFSARQYGGRPEVLDRLLASHQGRCRLDKITECSGLIDSLFLYATSLEGENFPAQMQDLDFHDDLSRNHAVVSYETIPYEQAGFSNLSLPRPVIARTSDILAHSRAGENLIRVDTDLERVAELMHKYPILTTYAAELRTLRDQFMKPQRDEWLRIFKACYRDINSCESQYAAFAQNQLKSLEYDPNLLQREADFVEVCLTADRDVRQTITAIFDAVRTWNCNDLARKIPDITALDLSRRQLSSLYPLTFFQLQSLDVSHNQVTNLSSLQNQSRLRTLNARDNRIDDVYPLIRLPLERLDLSYNSLTEVKALRSMSHLRHLQVHGNVVVDIDQLDSARFAALIRNEDEMCEQQRLTLLKLGDISYQQYLAYKDQNFAPQIIGDELDIKPCSVVVRDLNLL